MTLILQEGELYDLVMYIETKVQVHTLSVHLVIILKLKKLKHITTFFVLKYNSKLLVF